MYKVPIEVLKKCQDSLEALSILLTMSVSGKKLHKEEVSDELVKASNLINILKDNYNS